MGTVAQRLIRTICNKCKEAYKPPDEELAQLAGLSGLQPDVHTYKGTGCNTCYHSGYYGRKAIYEVLSVTAKIRKMILDKCNDSEIKQQAIAEGMKTLRKSGLDEVLNGTTTIEELSRLLDMRTE